MEKKYMEEAYFQAKKAYELNEVPVGAVIVFNNNVIAKAFNLKESLNCAVNHAEILAIKDASDYLGNWRLYECDMYVTLKPCPMCASAIKQSRIKNIYYATENLFDKNKAVEIILNETDNDRVVNIEKIEFASADKLLKKFFAERRLK